MDYDTLGYMFPPRPKKAIDEKMIGFYEKRGFVCQVKKNGTCNVTFALDDGVTFKTRHNADHKQWNANTATIDFFDQFPNSVFVSELMHNKTPHIKNINYIFDIIVYDGKSLIGKTFLERQAILDRIMPAAVDETYSHYILNEHIWLSKIHSVGFKDLFEKSKEFSEDEGLVFKRPAVPLEMCTKETSNNGWQYKVRKPTKNYGF